MIDTKQCLVCYAQTGKRRNQTLYWHQDPDSKDIWCWCNREDRAYTIWEYCEKAGVSLRDFLQQDFHFQTAPSNELNRMEWPKNFVPMFSDEAKPGVDYLKTRNLEPSEHLYYDTLRHGIVFPYHYDQTFCGAQIRLIEPKIDEDGNVQKITTLPGSRLGLLIYNWNQGFLPSSVKAFIVTEGAFNALAIQSALYSVYKPMECPYKCVALSGSGASQHHQEVFKEQIQQGRKVILAPDSDKAGARMASKMKEAGAVTHIAFTGDSDFDWNDVYKEISGREYVRWFLGKIKNV